MSDGASKVAELIENDPRLKYVGRAAVKTALKGLAKNKEVDQYFDESEIAQLLKPARRPRAKTGRKPPPTYKITAEPRSFQMDVTDFGAEHANKGYRYALLIVDILSRKCWLYPMKNHKMSTILDNYSKFLRSVGVNIKHVAKGAKIQMIEADDEFDAVEFKAFNDKLGIDTFTDFAKYDHISPGGDRLGIIDRLTGTLKRKLEIYYLENENAKWTAAIKDLVAYYNSDAHRTLESIHGKGTTPNDAWEIPESEQKNRNTGEQLENHAVDQETPQFAEGEQVRIQEYQGDKLAPSRVKWSKDIYTVTAKDGYKWRIETHEGNLLKRRFKHNELQRVPGKPKRVAVGLASAKETKKRTQVERVIRSKKVGIEPATVEAVEQPLETREQRSTRRIKEKAPAPEATLPNGADSHFIVKEILDKETFKVNGRKVVKYKVRWDKPYDQPKWDTWEPKSNLSRPGPKKLVEAFERRLRNQARS